MSIYDIDAAVDDPSDPDHSPADRDLKSEEGNANKFAPGYVARQWTNGARASLEHDGRSTIRSVSKKLRGQRENANGGDGR